MQLIGTRNHYRVWFIQVTRTGVKLGNWVVNQASYRARTNLSAVHFNKQLVHSTENIQSD
jgi:hypothetical protein